MHEKARTDLEVLSFAMDEVRLFLDTHPTNTCALKAYRQLRTQRGGSGRGVFLQRRRKKRLELGAGPVALGNGGISDVEL